VLGGTLQDISWVHQWADRVAEVHKVLGSYPEAAAALVAYVLGPNMAWPRFVASARPAAAAAATGCTQEPGTVSWHEAAARDEFVVALCGHLGCGVIFWGPPDSAEDSNEGLGSGAHRCCTIVSPITALHGCLLSYCTATMPCTLGPVVPVHPAMPSLRDLVSRKVPRTSYGRCHMKLLLVFRGCDECGQFSRILLFGAVPTPGVFAFYIFARRLRYRTKSDSDTE
jgi:hypothetical protein